MRAKFASMDKLGCSQDVHAMRGDAFCRGGQEHLGREKTLHRHWLAVRPVCLTHSILFSQDHSSFQWLHI
jgi:hypothetical protein